MARDFQKQHDCIRCLCVILALVCAVSFLLPHIHACEGKQCAVCALLSIREHLWFPTLTSTAIVTAAVHLLKLVIDCKSCSDDSLVELKVKLSN